MSEYRELRQAKDGKKPFSQRIYSPVEKEEPAPVASKEMK
jgi:hypothetical protein